MTSTLIRPSTAVTSVRPTIVSVLLASTLLPLAVTGPAVVLPDLAAGLHAGSGATQWVQNAYNTVFAATVLAAGSLADRLGRRRALRAGTAIFALAAALIAVAPDAPIVDVLRGAQGLGAAGIVAAGAAVLAHATTGAQRVRTFGLLGASFGAGLAFGPLLAGALSQLGWRAVFAAIAVAAGLALVVSRAVTESRDPSAARIDTLGMATFGGALLLLSLGFVSAGSRGWTDLATLGSFVGVLVLLALFVAVELIGDHPMFDVRLFRRPAFTAVICQPFSVTFGFVVLLVFLPVFLQGVHRLSPLVAACELLPLTVPVLAVPLTASRLTRRFSVRSLLVSGSALIAAGSLGLLVLGASSGALAPDLPLLVFGIGVGLAFCVMDNAAVSTVPVAEAGAAAGMFNTMRIAGESLAVAAAAAVLTTLTAARSTAADAAAAVQGHAVPATTGAAFANALHVVFVGLAVLATAGAAVTAWALRPAATAAEPAAAG